MLGNQIKLAAKVANFLAQENYVLILDWPLLFRIILDFLFTLIVVFIFDRTFWIFGRYRVGFGNVIRGFSSTNISRGLLLSLRSDLILNEIKDVLGILQLMRVSSRLDDFKENLYFLVGL